MNDHLGKVEVDEVYGIRHDESMISVVIPARNEEANIAKCLEALCAQDTKESIEVIVVDNGSTDRTADIANGFSGRLSSLRVIREPERGRGRARATGFTAASGDPIFSLDADTIVPPGWISAYMHIFTTDPNAVAVTGIPRIVDCDELSNKLFNTLLPIYIKAFKVVFQHFWLSGFSFAIRRSAYEAAGGFNPATDAYEDLDLTFKVHRTRTGKIRLEEENPVIFSGRRFKRGFVRGCMEYVTTFTVKFILRKERVLLSVINNDGHAIDGSPSMRKALGNVLIAGLRRSHAIAKQRVGTPVVKGVKKTVNGVKIVGVSLHKRMMKPSKKTTSNA